MTIVFGVFSFSLKANGAVNPNAIRYSDQLISAGALHTCAIVKGIAYCWGSNDFGQLGDGTNTDSTEPVPVKGLDSEPIAVFAGMTHSCAIVHRDREVWCWGRNHQGQLGNKTRIDSSIAVRVHGLTAIESVALGASHTCAKSSKAEVKCWGSNQEGQLGTGDRASSSTAVQVIGDWELDEVYAVAAHSNKTCALVRDIAVVPTVAIFCWGLNSGELGDAWAGISLVPKLVKELDPDFLQESRHTLGLHLGEFHGCVSDGTNYCWGLNLHGEMLSDSKESREFGGEPVVVPDKPDSFYFDVSSKFSTLTRIFTGTHFSCGRTHDRYVYCWGFHEDGRLGGRFDKDQFVLRRVKLNGRIQGLSVGSAHACVLSDGGVYCWGLNNQGQLGDGSNINREFPTPVNMKRPRVGGVSAGQNHTCSIYNGGVWCFGRNHEGQLGNGTNVDSKIPSQVLGLEENISKVVSGSNFSCALFKGRVMCWGENSSGQLGRGTTESSSLPKEVKGLVEVEMLAAGKNHVCAFTRKGKLFCWGTNLSGQLGVEFAKSFSAEPVEIPVMNAIPYDLALGDRFTCLLYDKRVYEYWIQPNKNRQIFPTIPSELNCWGEEFTIVRPEDGNIWTPRSLGFFKSSSGILGPAIRRIVHGLRVVSLKDSVLSFLCAGDSHLCLMSTFVPDPVKEVTSSALVSLGQSSYTGDVNTYSPDHNWLNSELGFPQGTQVGIETVAVAINANNHLCMIYREETLCLGKNVFGELGDQTNMNRATLAQVKGLGSNLRDVEVGGNHTCVIDDWDLKCWGRNTYGQLGNGSSEHSNKPVLVDFK